MTVFHVAFVPPKAPLAGQRMTSGQGKLAVGISKALTGQAITSAKGSVAFAKSGLTLLGQQITSTQGTVTSAGSLPLALTGRAITSTQGTITPAHQLVGQAITSHRGAVSMGHAQGLTGRLMTSRMNSPVTLNITTPSPLPDATASTPYSVTFSVVGYSSLPNLLWSLDAATPNTGQWMNVVRQPPVGQSGSLTGTPATAETESITVSVADTASMGPQFSKNFTFNVIPSGSTPQFPLLGAYMIAGTIDFVNVAHIAALGCAVFSNYQNYNAGTAGSLNNHIAQIKAKAPILSWVNPANMKICGIRNLMEIGTNPSGYSNEYTADVANNWFLRTIFPGGAIVASDAQPNSVNIASPRVSSATDNYAPAGSTYRQWNAAYSTSTGGTNPFPFATNLDGIYFDNVFAVYDKAGDYLENGTTQALGNATAIAAWQNAYVDAAAQFRTKLGANRMVWGNLARWTTGVDITKYNQVFNGGVIESAIGQSYSWETQTGGWLIMMNNYGKIMKALAPFQGKGPYAIFQTDAASGSTDYKTARYGLCSCLLDNGYFHWNTTGNAGNGSGVGWLDEMTFGLGTPIVGPNNSANGTYSSGGLTVWNQGVWRRDFANGIALVNPKGNGAKTVVVDAVNPCWHLRGTQDAVTNNHAQVAAGGTVTLADRDGLILSRTAT